MPKINDTFFQSPAHLDIARARYFRKQDGRYVEDDIGDVFERESSYIYKNDSSDHQQEALQYRLEKKIMPAGRPLAQADTDAKNLNNCYILGFKDDTREAISELKRQHFNTQSLGGGTGISFSTLRPEGSILKTSIGRSSGAVGFINDLSYQSSNIQQSGSRSGANLALLDDWHPDLYEFIVHKKHHNWENVRKFANITDENAFAEFQWNNHHHWQMMNVSVGLSDKFMQQVISNSNEPWILSWKGTEWPLWVFRNQQKEYIVAAPDFDTAKHKVSLRLPYYNNKNLELLQGPIHWTAKQWFRLIAEAAHEDGCPGVIFMDRTRAFHNLEYYNPISCTNPCGEVPAGVNATCNLTSLVLPSFWKDDCFDYEEFRNVIHEAVRGLDNIIDLSFIGEPEIDSNNRMERRIGLGTTGVGELLLLAKMKYSSEEGRNFVSDVLQFMRDEAYKASIALARERGSFSAFDFEQYKKSAFFDTLPSDIQAQIRQYGIRNGVLLTQAPTGCQKKETLVVSEDGIVELQELMNISGEKWQNLKTKVLQDSGKYVDTSFSFLNGEAKTKKIKLYSGIELESTYNHQYKILRGDEYIWERVDRLQVGDILVSKIGGYNKQSEQELIEIPRDHPNSKYIKSPKVMSPALARILGFYFADGSNHQRGIRLHFDASHTEIIEYYQKLIKEVFDVDDLCIQTRRGCSSLYINSVSLLQFLSVNYLLKDKSYDVEIPWIIRTSSAASLRAFIDGYWDGDGSISGLVKYIGTTSFKMAQQLAVCQRALGINIKIDTYTNRQNSFGKRPIYRVKEIQYGSDKFVRAKEKFIRMELKDACKKLVGFGEALFPDKIVNIEESHSLTLDIEVPGSSAYIANSIVSHNTTGTILGYSQGCEPYFAMAYVRNSKVGSFTDGSPCFRQWLADNNIDYAKYNHSLNELRKKIEVPDYFEEAHEISWQDHIKMQAVFAKNVDQSVSKTINAPNSVTVDDVEQMFITAYTSGVKSTTIYRDGSKQQVLEHIKQDHNHDRPEQLSCDIHHVTVRGGKWVVLVGMNQDKPYEVFCAPQEKFELSKNCKTGVILKEGRGKFNLVVGDFVIKDIASLTLNDEQKSLTRMVSLLIRNKVSLNEILDQLDKSNGSVVDFSKALLRVLNKYRSADEKVSGQKCMNCGSTNLVSTAGCISCLDCGGSKCG
jgi:ribonucleotide reductase alpha subunit/intein/homing endonuclease